MDIAELEVFAGRGKLFPELGTSYVTMGATVTRAAQDALSGFHKTPDVLALETAGLGSMDTLFKQMGGLSSPFGAAIQAQIKAMEQASDVANFARLSGLSASPMNALAEELREGSRLNPLNSTSGQFLELPEPYLPPPMPPNPILETNELLEELSGEFTELRMVVAATAVVQERQAELIDKLLAAQVQGAASQERARKQTLRIALWGLVIAIGSIVASFIT